MRANRKFLGLDKRFWAHVRSLSQELGYTDRGRKSIKVPTIAELAQGIRDLELQDDHIINKGKATAFAKQLRAYFAYRARVLNNEVQHQLMNAAQARSLYEKLAVQRKYKVAAVMNKQKGKKKKVAYLTVMVNMLVEANAKNISFDHNPTKLTTITEDGRPLRTLARRVDGAFPSAVNPVAVWEVKEYYHTTTFGSRVADGVYESLLDGLELEEMRIETGVAVEHALIVDAHYTWWDCGRAYLCRIVDMLHMGYVDDVLFGSEIEEELPRLVRRWVNKTRKRQRKAKRVLRDDTAVL